VAEKFTKPVGFFEAKFDDEKYLNDSEVAFYRNFECNIYLSNMFHLFSLMNISTLKVGANR